VVPGVGGKTEREINRRDATLISFAVIML